MVVRGNKRVSGKRESTNKRREWDGANDGEIRTRYLAFRPLSVLGEPRADRCSDFIYYFIILICVLKYCFLFGFN